MKVSFGNKPLKISQIAEMCGGSLYRDFGGDDEIKHICTDSREAEKNCLFLAIRGEKVDGHNYINKAAELGAACAIAERAVEGVEIPLIIVDDTLAAIAALSTAYAEEYHGDVRKVAVTGSVGKTTTIGKLAAQLKKAGKKVWIGAADTFRAAAVEQLTIWSERAGVPIVKQQMGSDPASVAYDTVSSAVAQGADVVLIDTAGRLHNKINLMNELTKIRNVMRKVIPDAPHEVLLVLDGSTGQNAFLQAKEFTKATEVTALAVTKLDGTAKGGVVIGIADQFQIPVKFIGVGEKIEDLQVFNKKAFIDSLFK